MSSARPAGRELRGRAAWGLATVDVVAVLVARLADPSGEPGMAVLYGLGIASFTFIGALLRTRVPTNPIGTMLLAAGTVLVVALTLGAYASIGLGHEPPWPGSGPARTVGDALFIYPIVIALIGIPLYFPNGRLPSPRFRWAVRILIANMVIWTLEVTFGLLRDSGAASAVPGLLDLAPIFDALELFVFFATIVTFGAGVVAIWLRFRLGDQVQRQQVKWLVAVVSMGAIAFPVEFMVQNTDNLALADALTIIGFLALFALPIAIGVAVLRYRLYAIDRIISRTIAYGVVTAILGALFIGIVLALQAVLAPITSGQTIAVAASTLAVFALFQPLLRRVRRSVDRRFDRARYDADLTVRTFAARLRGDIDLGTVRSEILDTATSAVRPTTAGVWLRASRTERTAR